MHPAAPTPAAHAAAVAGQAAAAIKEVAHMGAHAAEAVFKGKSPLQWASRHKPAAAAIVLGLLVLIGVIIIIATRGGKPSSTAATTPPPAANTPAPAQNNQPTPPANNNNNNPFNNLLHNNPNPNPVHNDNPPANNNLVTREKLIGTWDASGGTTVIDLREDGQVDISTPNLNYEGHGTWTNNNTSFSVHLTQQSRPLYSAWMTYQVLSLNDQYMRLSAANQTFTWEKE
jgi:hypothetical protein